MSWMDNNACMHAQGRNDSQTTLTEIVEVLLDHPHQEPRRPLIVAAHPEFLSLGLFPNTWQTFPLTSSIGSVQDLLLKEQQDVVFIPPWGRNYLLDAETRAEFPRFDLHEAMMAALLPRLPNSSRVLLIIPAGTLVTAHRENIRQQLFEEWHPDFILYATSPGLLPGTHASFRLAIVRLLSRQRHETGQRFAEIEGGPAADSVRSDLEQLMKRNRGQSKYGYVLEDPLPPAAALGFREHHPQRSRSREKVEGLGKTVRLGDMFDILYGRPLDHRESLDAQEDGPRALLVRAKNISRKGTVDLDFAQVVEAKDGTRLQSGDLIMRELYSNSGNGLAVAVVPEISHTLTASRHVLILRSKKRLTTSESEFVSAYLRSQYADTLLGLDAGILHINRGRLLELPIPVPGASLKKAIDDLHNAAELFQRWQREALAVVQQIFDGKDLDSSHAKAISIGQRVRQRASYATSLDDLGTRLRMLLPHPIALWWRKIEATKPDIAGYNQVIQSAESLLCFCAIIGCTMARQSGIDIPYLGNIRERFATTRHGMNFGDWSSILSYLAGSSVQKQLSATTPFSEITNILSDKDVNGARNSLAKRRNANAHGCGPEPEEVADAYKDARAYLQVLFSGVEWLSEYPLRLVLETRWDSMAGIAEVTYRELMGDHAVVPYAGLRTTQILESGSLYIVDRLGEHHLLRPLLHADACPRCRRLSVFVFNKWDPKTDLAEYRALDHGHQITVPGAAEALRMIGFLPPATQ